MPDIRHKRVSGVPDTGDVTLIQGPDWNDGHNLVQGGASLLGRADSAPGPTQEVQIDPATMAFVGGKLAAVIQPPPTTLPPSGPAGGDLTGTYPNPTIKADVALTGTPTAPTPATADNDASIATTQFVKAQGYATTGSIPTTLPPSGPAGGALSGTYPNPGLAVPYPTSLPPNGAAGGDLTGTYPNPTLVGGPLSNYAPLASPVFSGTPTAPTPTPSDNGTSIATTAFVKAQGYVTGGPFAPLTSPAFSGNPTAPTQSPGDNDQSIATTSFVTAAIAAQPASAGAATRQTVSAGPVSAAGAPTFFPATSGALNLAQINVNSAAPFVVTAANGWSATNGQTNDRIGHFTAPFVWTGFTASRAAATPNYLYVTVNANGTMTTGSTLLPPIYQPGGVPAITNGQFTFNVGEMRGYMGNGATAPQAYIVFVGEAATDATTVISTVAYAYNGIYDSDFTATLPSVAVITSKNHNIGSQPRAIDFVAECTSADNGFAVGDQLHYPALVTATAGLNIPAPLNSTRNGISITTGGTFAFTTVTKSTGGAAQLTLASWKYKFIASRGW